MGLYSLCFQENTWFSGHLEIFYRNVDPSNGKKTWFLFDLHILWVLNFTIAWSYLGTPHCFLFFTISSKLDIFQDNEELQKRPNTNTCFHDGDIESFQRSFNGVSSSQGNNYTSEKQTKRTHLFGFFAPPHPGTIIYPAIWTGTVLFCCSRWVLRRLQEKHLWMDKKYWKWRNSRATRSWVMVFSGFL